MEELVFMLEWGTIKAILMEEEAKAVQRMSVAASELELGTAQGAYRLSKLLQETLVRRVKEQKGVIQSGLQR